MAKVLAASAALADVIGNAVHVMQIATGQQVDTLLHRGGARASIAASLRRRCRRSLTPPTSSEQSRRSLVHR